MKFPILLGMLFPVAVLTVTLPVVTLSDRGHDGAGMTTSTAVIPTAPSANTPQSPAPSAPTTSPEPPEDTNRAPSAASPSATRQPAQVPVADGNLNVRYAEQLRGVIDQTASGEYSPDASYAIGNLPQDTPALAEGEHVELVRSNCSVCHATTFITSQPPLTQDVWRAEVYKMKEKYGATFINDDQAEKIIAYLGAHYTPETRADPAAPDGR